MGANMVYYRVRKIHGKYYLYKEWYEPETKKRRSISLGNCEEIEKHVLDIKNRLLMPPRGFEPRTSRSSAEVLNRFMDIVCHSDVGVSNRFISGKLIVSESVLGFFAKWLRDQGVSEKTVKGHYLPYLRRLIGFTFTCKRDVVRAFKIMGFNKTSYEALSRFLTFAEKNFEGCEGLVYVLRRAMPSKPRSKPDTYIPPDSLVLQAKGKAAKLGEPYVTLWNILLTTGCRVTEAVHLVKTYDSRREVEVSEEILRYHIDFERKSKREHVMYFPKWLKRKIVEASKKLPGYNTLRDRFRRNIIPPKYLRKWFRQKLKKHKVDSEVIEFLQGRILTVGMKHYTDFIVLADKLYPQEIYPIIKPYLIKPESQTHNIAATT